MGYRFSPEQLNSLVAQGQLAPETAQTVLARQPQPALSPVTQLVANTALANEQPQMQETDIAPTVAPSDLAITPTASAPSVQVSPINLQPYGDPYGGIGAYTAAGNAAAGAARSEGLAAAKQAEEVAKAQKEAYDKQAQVTADIQGKEVDRQAKIQGQVDKAAQAMQAYDEAKLDPEKANIFVNGDTKDKIGAGIAIMLGAVGGALTGKGGNTAMDVLNNAINRDIDAQKLEIEKKGKKAQMEQNALSQLTSVLGDQRQAELVLKNMQLQDAQGQIQAISTQYQAPMLRAQAEKAGALIQAEMEKNKIAFVQAANQNALQQQVTQQALTQQQQKQQMQSGRVAMDTKNINPEALTKEERERFVPGYGFASSNEEAKKVRDSLIANKDINDLLDRVEILRKEKGGTLFDRSAVRTADLLKKQILLKIKGLEQTGALDAGTIDVVGPLLPDATEINPSRLNPWADDPVKAQITELRKSLKGMIDSQISTRLTTPTPTLRTLKPN